MNGHRRIRACFMFGALPSQLQTRTRAISYRVQSINMHRMPAYQLITRTKHILLIGFIINMYPSRAHVQLGIRHCHASG